MLINPPVPSNQAWVREGRCQQWDIWGAPFPPLSLALISTQLVRSGVQTRILDSGPEGKSCEQVLQECKLFKPKMAILATVTPTIDTDLAWFAGGLRKRIPGIRIAVIGIHVSVLPVDVLDRFSAVDYVIMGEPEITSKELASSLFHGHPSIQNVFGIAYRAENGTIRVNPQRPLVSDVDSLGLPDWIKIDFGFYQLPLVNRPFSLIVFARGCPFECRFCASHVYNGRRLRKRSIKSLLGEIHFNLKLGVRDFLFWTEQMTLDRTYLDEFLEALLAEGLHNQIRWVCNSRVDCAEVPLFRKMKQAGCWQIAFGFEFGNDRILELACKGGRSSVKQSRAAAKAAHQAGLVVDGHFILGYPGETVRTLQQTIDLACSLPLTFAHFYPAVPFPGSQLYEEALANGWIEPLQWAAISQDMSCLMMSELSPGVVKDYIRKAYRRFYLRPETIMRVLRIPHSAGDYLNMVRLGLRIIRAKVLCAS